MRQRELRRTRTRCGTALNRGKDEDRRRTRKCLCACPPCTRFLPRLARPTQHQTCVGKTTPSGRTRAIRRDLSIPVAAAWPGSSSRLLRGRLSTASGGRTTMCSDDRKWTCGHGESPIQTARSGERYRPLTTGRREGERKVDSQRSSQEWVVEVDLPSVPASPSRVVEGNGPSTEKTAGICGPMGMRGRGVRYDGLGSRRLRGHRFVSCVMTPSAWSRAETHSTEKGTFLLSSDGGTKKVWRSTSTCAIDQT